MKRLAVVLVLVLALVAPVAAQQPTNRALSIQCYSGGEDIFRITGRSIQPDSIPGWVRIISVTGTPYQIVRTNLKCTYVDISNKRVVWNDYWRFGYPGTETIQCFSGADLEWEADARSIATDTLPGWVRVRNDLVDSNRPGPVRITNMGCVFIQR